MSLGTGVSAAPKVKGSEVSRLKWDSLTNEFTIDADAYAHSKVLGQVLKSQAKNNKELVNYIRMQVETDLSMDSTAKSNIDALLSKGQDMWDEFKDTGGKKMIE